VFFAVVNGNTVFLYNLNVIELFNFDFAGDFSYIEADVHSF
jgi:hypothetical protein